MLGLALALLLAQVPDPGAARAELAACAARIEELKARHLAGEPVGRELVRLLVRAQELAAQLDRVGAALPPPPLAPSPEELRERADAARDDADRLAAEIAALDVTLGDLRRAVRAEVDGPVARATLGAPTILAEAARLRELEARRAALVRARAHAEAAAAQWEAEARSAEAAR